MCEIPSTSQITNNNKQTTKYKKNIKTNAENFPMQGARANGNLESVCCLVFSAGNFVVVA